jgi:hypothetical protein
MPAELDPDLIVHHKNVGSHGFNGNNVPCMAMVVLALL